MKILRIRPRPIKIRMYPVPCVAVDRSGRVKLETLETIYLESGWVSVNELLEDPLLGSALRQGRSFLAMRLLRYARQDLLQRKRFKDHYKYRITNKGKERIIFLYKKFGLLTPPPDWRSMGDQGETAYQLAEQRKKIDLDITKQLLKEARRELLKLELI